MRPWLQFALATLSAFGWPSIAAAQRVEALWYLAGEKSIQSFIAHADQITIAAPQVFAMDSTGRIRGRVDARVIETARARGVKLMPLVVNPGFDQRAFHRVLTNRVARTRALRSLAALCRVNRFDGIQFDFENIYIRDRNAFTAFTRQAVDSLHRAGCELSAALVPRFSENPGTNSYDRWIYDNWRGAYDFKALADTLDFISYMTYAQHTGESPPGPVSGYPWMMECLRYLLSLGVSPSKISLGLASYSDWWYPTYDKRHGPRLRGGDISYARGKAILDGAGVVPVWDSVQKAPHAEWEDNAVFRHAWLEDGRAFMTKLELVNQYHLRGYSVWVLGTEDDAVWGLLEGRH